MSKQESMIKKVKEDGLKSGKSLEEIAQEMNTVRKKNEDNRVVTAQINPFPTKISIDVLSNAYVSLPQHVRADWLSRRGDFGSYPILIDEQAIPKIELHEGDIFNAILMSPGKGKDYRIFQFLPKYSGYAKQDDFQKIYDVPTFPRLVVNLVYRFELFRISYPRGSEIPVLHARPLWPVDLEDAKYLQYTPKEKVTLRRLPETQPNR
jgi:hypothetical protein